MNPYHIHVARRYFHVQQNNVNLVRADAVQWVKDYNGEKFDLIVDDLFGDHDGEPVRAVAADSHWFRKLNRLLSKDGVLVTNFVSNRQMKQSAYFTDEKISHLFGSVFQFMAPQYENVIGVFFKPEFTQRHLKQNLMMIPQLDPRLKSCRLRYTVRRA